MTRCPFAVQLRTPAGALGRARRAAQVDTFSPQPDVRDNCGDAR